MRRPRVYWRWCKWKLTKDGWEPTDTGWVLTLSLMFLLLNIGLLEDEGVAKFDQFLALKPSEMGDTLAGLFSALAFIWIIVTVFIQSRELRETRVEVKQQRVASEKMAVSLNAQAVLFEDEKIYRDHTRAKELLDEKLLGLCDLLHMSAVGFVGWSFVESEPSYDAKSGSMTGPDVEVLREIGIFKQRDDRGSAEYLKASETHCRLANTVLTQVTEKLVRKPKNSDDIERIATRLQEIDDMTPLLSRDQKERVRNLRLLELLEHVEELLDREFLWEYPRNTP